jgi:hypothetical protein
MSNLAKFQIFAAAQLDVNRSFSFQGGASAARTPRATDAFRTKTLGRCGTILHRLLLRPILNRSAVDDLGYFPNCRITVKAHSPNRDYPASGWGGEPRLQAIGNAYRVEQALIVPPASTKAFNKRSVSRRASGGRRDAFVTCVERRSHFSAAAAPRTAPGRATPLRQRPPEGSAPRPAG